MKIKYITSIITGIIIASVAGFMIWHLMWMTGIEKRFRTEHSSGKASTIEVKEKKDNHRRGMADENRPVSEEETVSVHESGTQTNQTKKTLTAVRNPGENASGPDAGLPGGDILPNSDRSSPKWFEKDIGFGKKPKQPNPGNGMTTTEVSGNKTMSTTTTNKTNPVKRENILQPMNMPEMKVPGVVSPPTSTVP